MGIQYCEQIITGRNYDYARALETIQREEYLKDSDFVPNLQQITKKHGKLLEELDTLEEKFANAYEELDLDNGYHRDKRALFDSSLVNITNTNITTTTFMLASTALVAVLVFSAANPT